MRRSDDALKRVRVTRTEHGGVGVVRAALRQIENELTQVQAYIDAGDEAKAADQWQKMVQTVWSLAELFVPNDVS